MGSKRKSSDQPRVVVKLKRLNTPANSSKQNSTNTNAKALSVTNRYAVLTDNENEMDVISQPPPKIKIPPIVVSSASYAEISAFMGKINVKDYNLKYISMGIKILCHSLDDYNASVNGLKENKVQFYSHDIVSQQNMKFVLSGLPDLTIDEVKTGLQSANIQFVDVKKMRTRSDNKHYALYLVYFANKSTKLSELKAIKYILNIVVTWSPYIASKKGPTQCNNCQLHGHGSKNCNLPPRCSKYGGTHASSECLRFQYPLPEQLPEFVCCLCGNAHLSRDRKCPKRIDYMNMKISRTSNKPKHSVNNSSRSSQQQSFTRNESEFPALKVQQGRKFSDWFPTSQPVLPPMNVNTSEDLFSPQQLLELTTELISNLRTCRTKLDQFQAITKLAIKYVSYV